MNLLSIAASAQWAMQQERLDELLQIAARENEVTPELLEQYRSRNMSNAERAKVRDTTGILYVQGPLFKRANLFTEISGATSYETLARDFRAALDDFSVNSIALYIDSPGGEASGCDEFANMIYEARGQKPITAFVSGMACSAAYWIASAADRIVASDLSVLGSIGVVLSTSTRDPKPGEKRFEFVSSQSPHKRVDMETDAGKAQIQKRVDALADVFISTVARNRGVSVETVIEKFGAGGVEVGAAAVALGLADGVGQFEAILADLKKGGNRRSTALNKGSSHMSKTENGGVAETADLDTVRAEATKAANLRIQAIIGSEAAASAPATAQFLAFSTGLSGEEASKVLAAVKTDIDTAKAKEPAPVADAEKPTAEAAYLASKTQATNLNAPDLGAGKSNPMAAAVAKMNKL